MDRIGGTGPHLQRLLSYLAIREKLFRFIPFPLPPSDGQNGTYNTYTMHYVTDTFTIAPLFSLSATLHCASKMGNLPTSVSLSITLTP